MSGPGRGVEVALDTPRGRVAALRFGDGAGPRVLALHGWLDNAASFVPMAPHLAGLDLVAIDLPGHGRSDHLPAPAEYSHANAIHAVLDVADALGWERFALLGHSMGAGIASLVAAAAPQRVARLVAIEALGALAGDPAQTATRLQESIAAQRASRGRSLRVFPTLAPAIAARMQANALSEPVARLLVERGTRAVVGGFAWSSDPRLMSPTVFRLTEEQIRALIAAVACPARVAFADPAQPYLPDALRRERVACLPRGELVVIPGTHHLHMEDPATVAAAIAPFLRATDEPESPM